MTLPVAAIPQDLDQWRLWVERQLRGLTSTALSRPRLEVTAGDFYVRNGGNIFVVNGGQVSTRDSAGASADLFNGALWLRADPGVYWGKINSDGGGPNLTRLNITPPFYEANGSQNDTYIILDGASPTTSGRAYLRVGQQMMLTADSADFILGSASRVLWLTGSRIQLNGVSTTSSAANMRLDGGRIFQSTSSRRYKRNVRPAGIDPDAVLSLEPKTWRDRNDVAEHGDNARWHAGLIAEDVHDAGLSQFVDYDDEGRPDALQYDRLGTAGLLTVARRQHEQITDLQTENANLTARLARLESHLGLQEPAGDGATTLPAQEANS